MTVPIWLQNTDTAEFFRRRTVVTNQSPFTGAVFQSAYPDARWVAKISYVEMTRAEAAPLLAAIDAQRDGLGTIGLFDPDFAVPQSGFAGTGTVAATPPFGATALATAGWPASTLLAMAGDKLYIGFAPLQFRICTVTADVTANASGLATVPVDELPLLPLVGAAVFFNCLSRGTMPMRLVSHQRLSLPGARFRISIEAEERI